MQEIFKAALADLISTLKSETGAIPKDVQQARYNNAGPKFILRMLEKYGQGRYTITIKKDGEPLQ